MFNISFSVGGVLYHMPVGNRKKCIWNQWSYENIVFYLYIVIFISQCQAVR